MAALSQNIGHVLLLSLGTRAGGYLQGSSRATTRPAGRARRKYLEVSRVGSGRVGSGRVGSGRVGSRVFQSLTDWVAGLTREV